MKSDKKPKVKSVSCYKYKYVLRVKDTDKYFNCSLNYFISYFKHDNKFNELVDFNNACMFNSYTILKNEIICALTYNDQIFNSSRGKKLKKFIEKLEIVKIKCQFTEISKVGIYNEKINRELILEKLKSEI